MSIAEKLKQVAENEHKVFDAGYTKGKTEGTEEGYANGYTEGEIKGYQEGYNIQDEAIAEANEKLAKTLLGTDTGAESWYDRFWDAFQQNGTRRSYEYAFSGSCWSTDILKPKYPIKIVDTTDTSRFAMGMFWRFNRDKHLGELFDVSRLCEMIDLTECRDISNIFSNANVSNIILNVPKVKNMSSAFQLGDGGCIDIITLTVTDACTNYSNTFRTSSLGSLTFTEGSVIGANISFQYATKLTHESLMNIINILKNYSGTSETCTCTLGTTNLNKLTDAEKAIATQKGWTLA